MRNRILYVFVLFTMILSACGGTSTPTQSPTQTSAPKVAVTKTPLPSATKTATPADASACVDSAAFVADVTVPDHDHMDKGEAFTKIWRIRNTGTCTWDSKYTLVFKTGEQMGAPDSTSLKGETAPGAALDIPVDMTAPNTDASFRADFEIHDPSGKAIPIDKDTVLWVIVTVGSAVANTGGGTPASGGTSSPGYAVVTCDFTLNPAKIDSVAAAINTYRTNNGVPAYAVNDDLNKAAQAHANDMACNSLFVHTGSNGSTPQSRVAFSGYLASSVSENVYGAYPDPTGQQVVTWWATDQTDPRHNQNLLSTKFTEIGVGYAFYKNYGYYVVVFATPQ